MANVCVKHKKKNEECFAYARKTKHHCLHHQDQPYNSTTIWKVIDFVKAEVSLLWKEHVACKL